MRFLIVAKSKHLLPPELAPGVLDGTIAWAKKYTEKGKIEQVWHFVGVPAGGGIANVNSLDELDAIMAEFPLWPFTEIEIHPLTDLNDAVQRREQAMQGMAAGGRR